MLHVFFTLLCFLLHRHLYIPFLRGKCLVSQAEGTLAVIHVYICNSALEPTPFCISFFTHICSVGLFNV